jgi:hypothetical protein
LDFGLRDDAAQILNHNLSSVRLRVLRASVLK